MNLRSFLILIICISCLLSCGKGGSNPQNMLAGTWTLQQQQVVMYEDTVKITDTTLNAAATTYGSVQFNTDDTYSSSSVYFTGNTSLSGPPPESQKSTGKYSYSKGIFTISPGLAGWYTYVLGATGPPTNVSQSIGITQLTGIHLIVHGENKFTLTGVTGTHTYDLLLDNYYSK